MTHSTRQHQVVRCKITRSIRLTRAYQPVPSPSHIETSKTQIVVVVQYPEPHPPAQHVAPRGHMPYHGDHGDQVPAHCPHSPPSVPHRHCGIDWLVAPSPGIRDCRASIGQSSCAWRACNTWSASTAHITRPSQRPLMIAPPPHLPRLSQGARLARDWLFTSSHHITVSSHHALGTHLSSPNLGSDCCQREATMRARTTAKFTPSPVLCSLDGVCHHQVGREVGARDGMPSASTRPSQLRCASPARGRLTPFRVDSLRPPWARTAGCWQRPILARR